MTDVLIQTDFPDVKLVRRGKVRDVYEVGDHLLIVTTDRVSAFDVVLPNGIPGKGKVLTGISLYWFGQMTDIIENHIVATNVDDYPEILKKYRPQLEGRSMLVKKAQPLTIECIVRGYLSGSGWKEYQKSQTVCSIPLPAGLVESSRLEQPIFTPSTKAEEGHDINISYAEAERIVGAETAAQVRDTALAIYTKARSMAEKKGIIIADTKMEMGYYDGKLILIDEVLTPDSSRFWSIKDYAPGKSQDSYDKQIVRDYLLTLDWNQQYPGPKLPDEIVAKTAARYEEILGILTK
ncbi:MAG: phosphoribosylaminoimidazolesuccinocarboxamide synthase [Nitrospiraceae bacterium]|jgi:phosphoribosylaminoimidazole-succinocarboxamide synthase|nr:phosphoribosylaminoimidazolesuccinocarboxamide synthase [Nitrospiraceae bacterium]